MAVTSSQAPIAWSHPHLKHNPTAGASPPANPAAHAGDIYSTFRCPRNSSRVLPTPSTPSRSPSTTAAPHRGNIAVNHLEELVSFRTFTDLFVFSVHRHFRVIGLIKGRELAKQSSSIPKYRKIESFNAGGAYRFIDW